MQLGSPAPRRSVYSAYYQGQQTVDYSMTQPLLADGMDFPCKTYPAGPFENRIYTAGQSVTASVVGSANHGGGHCQFALSYDNGQTVRPCLIARVCWFKRPSFRHALCVCLRSVFQLSG